MYEEEKNEKIQGFKNAKWEKQKDGTEIKRFDGTAFEVTPVDTKDGKKYSAKAVWYGPGWPVPFGPCSYITRKEAKELALEFYKGIIALKEEFMQGYAPAKQGEL